MGGDEVLEESIVSDAVELPIISMTNIDEFPTSTTTATASTNVQSSESTGISLKLSRNQWGGKKRSRLSEEQDNTNDYVNVTDISSSKQKKLKLVL